MNNQQSIAGISDNKSRILLPIFIAITLSALFLLNRGISSVSRLTSLALIIVGIFLHVNDLICLIAAILPTGNVYMVTSGNTVIPFLLVIYLAKTVVRNRRSIDVEAMKSLVWVLVLIVISLSTTTFYGITVMKILPFYLHVVFIIFALRVNRVNQEWIYNKVALHFVTGTLLVCVGTTLFPDLTYSLGNASIYVKENAGFSSTWDFGRSLTISIAFIVVDMLKARKRILIDLPLCLIMLYFIIQSGRFSMLLGLGALIALFPFITGKDKPLHQRVFHSLIMIGVMLVAVVALYQLIYLPMSTLRGSAASDNGRFDIWRKYIECINQDALLALFGVGGGAVASFADMIGYPTAHNILLEKIVEVGFVGIIIFAMFFVSLYKGKDISPFRNINVLPLVAFLGTSLTQGTTGNIAFALLLALCAKDRLDGGVTYI